MRINNVKHGQTQDAFGDYLDKITRQLLYIAGETDTFIDGSQPTLPDAYRALFRDLQSELPRNEVVYAAINQHSIPKTMEYLGYENFSDFVRARVKIPLAHAYNHMLNPTQNEVMVTLLTRRHADLVAVTAAHFRMLYKVMDRPFPDAHNDVLERDAWLL